MCVHVHMHANVHVSTAGFQNTIVRMNSAKWELRPSLVPSEHCSISQGS